MKIADYLGSGADNATTGRELAAILNVDIRTIAELVELERREGAKICATSRGKNPGYFIAATDEELEYYCNRLHHRASEMEKTRRLLLATLGKVAVKKAQAQNNKK